MVTMSFFPSRMHTIAPVPSLCGVCGSHGSQQLNRKTRRTVHVAASPTELKDCAITPLDAKPDCQFNGVWSPGSQDVTLLIFFTHWADLGSWELAQRLVEVLPEIQAKGVHITAVGVGTKSAGQLFAEKTKFPAELLYADPIAACHKTLGYSAGFLPESDVNGYLKLLPMLAGIGSPGTVQEVLRGYVGDRESKAIFEPDSFMGKAFGVLGDGYQRPFELATVRLNNMIGSLSNWSDLAPEDTQLLVQQGGAMLLKGEEVLFSHEDTGILMTTQTDPLMEAVVKATAAQLPSASS